jgi:acyl carrier protein
MDNAFIINDRRAPSPVKSRSKPEQNGGEKMDELLTLLKGICPKVDFVNEKKLIDDGKLDSFDIISIVNELNEHYDIEIDVDDLEPDNFNTVEAMLELIEKLRNE